MRKKLQLARLFRSQVLTLLVLLSLAGCATNQTRPDGPPTRYVNYHNIPDAVPKKLPKSPYGNPTSYRIDGKVYHVLKSSLGYDQRGIASWYGTKFHGQLTSTHVPYDMFAMTAASPILPIPCFVQVTNLKNGRSVIVKVNDRGPFAENRIIDLSYVAAEKLGYAQIGTALVDVRAINIGRPEPSQYHQFELANNKAYPRLYLQLGAFHDLQFAQRLASHAKHITHEKIEIVESHNRVKPLYRVRVGPLAGVNQSDYLDHKFTRLHIGNPVTVIQ